MRAYTGDEGNLEIFSQLLPRSPHTYLQPEVRGSSIGGSRRGGFGGGKIAEPLPPPHTHACRLMLTHTHYIHTIRLTA